MRQSGNIYILSWMDAGTIELDQGKEVKACKREQERTNCREPEGVNKDEALKWAAESYNMLLEYAVPAGISVCIENHGGVSNDADWMVALLKEVNNLYFGSYPDWRAPAQDFNNVEYLENLITNTNILTLVHSWLLLFLATNARIKPDCISHLILRYTVMYASEL